MKYWKTIAIYTVIGMLLGLLHVRFLASGYSKQWKQHPQPNGVHFEIVSMSWRTVYIQTTDNTFLECAEYKETCSPTENFLVLSFSVSVLETLTRS